MTDYLRSLRNGPRGLEAKIVESIGALIGRMRFLEAKEAEVGRLHRGSELELAALRWVLSDPIANHYGSLIADGERWAEEAREHSNRRRAARDQSGDRS